MFLYIIFVFKKKKVRKRKFDWRKRRKERIQFHETLFFQKKNKTPSWAISIIFHPIKSLHFIVTCPVNKSNMDGLLNLIYLV
jgi:hypothetical protein